MKDYHIERIVCPNCGSTQRAKVRHTNPFNSYVHRCKRCSYYIMESEWEKAEGLDPIWIVFAIFAILFTACYLWL